MRNSSGLLLALSATLLLLSACGGSTVSNPVTPSTPSTTPSVPAVTPSAPAAVTVASVTVTSSTATPVVGSTAKLSVTVKGSDGSILTDRTVTYTSSNPQALAVSADGTLTSRHLGPINTAVTITATADGMSGTTTVSPWGLDVAGGTYNHPADNQGLGSDYFIRYHNSDGSLIASDTPMVITRPDGTVYNTTYFAGVDNNPYRDTVAPQSGTYTLSMTTGGQALIRTFSIDASQVQVVASAVTVGGDATTAQIGGTLPAGAAAIQVYAQSSSQYASTGSLYTLPASKTWRSDGSVLPSGTYTTNIAAYSAPRTNAYTTPDILNLSSTPGPTLSF